jgi:alpha-1,4-digalacturonate transport system permease protein
MVTSKTNTYSIVVPDGERKRPRRAVRGKFARSVIPTTLLWVLAALMAFPLLWFLLSSFKPGSELFSYPLSFFPRTWTIDGYTEALDRFDFFRYLFNSFAVASISTILTVFLCATTGYALAKYRNSSTRCSS